MDAYEDEVQGFIGRVKGRAHVRIEKAMKEYEEVCMRPLVRSVNYYNILQSKSGFLRKTLLPTIQAYLIIMCFSLLSCCLSFILPLLSCIKEGTRF